jgi:hypothetical protein
LVAPADPAALAFALAAVWSGCTMPARAPVVATALPAGEETALAEETATFWSLLESAGIGRSWNTWADTSTTKAAIAMPITTTPESAPTK